MTPIRWDWISQAVTFYSGAGYSYIEAPWIVDAISLSATIPEGKYGFGLKHPVLRPGYLVGSAEQGFIQMMREGRLTAGIKACAAGPCFRDEDVDEWRLPYFFKVELIEVEPDTKSISKMIYAVSNFVFQTTGMVPQQVETDEGIDLTINNIEIGSYGIRSFGKFTWAYGTGLALPRLSQAIKIY